MVEQYLRCYIDYQQDNLADCCHLLVYNKVVHSSTSLTPFQVTSAMDFGSIPELPREPPISLSLAEWMESL